MRLFVAFGAVALGYVVYREYLKRKATAPGLVHLPGAPEATAEDVALLTEAMEPWQVNLERDFMG